jgi:hypothetical protein
MSDVAACFRDGYSSTGTSGTGLGAIRRQADEFDIYTQPGRGTALLARFWSSRPASPGPLEIGAVCLPIHGEDAPGDAWSVVAGTTTTRLVVADGLGHGPLAAEAAGAAIASAREHPERPLTPLLEGLHETLRATRGAVAAVAELDVRRELVHFAGIGNISAALWGAQKQQNLVSMNGTLGHTLGHVRDFSYPWPADALVILHSDGLATRWSLDDYPGLQARDPALVAGVLYRDFSRGRDDVTVVVARRRGRR